MTDENADDSKCGYVWGTIEGYKGNDTKGTEGQNACGPQREHIGKERTVYCASNVGRTAQASTRAGTDPSEHLRNLAQQRVVFRQHVDLRVRVRMSECTPWAVRKYVPIHIGTSACFQFGIDTYTLSLSLSHTHTHTHQALEADVVLQPVVALGEPLAIARGLVVRRGLAPPQPVREVVADGVHGSCQRPIVPGRSRPCTEMEVKESTY